MTLLSRLDHLLTYVRDRAGDDFSGVGVVVYLDVNCIPAFSMNSEPLATPELSTPAVILSLSSTSSRYHDGFHLLNLDLKVTHSCQYLAPPIDARVKPTELRGTGARYMTALFASMIHSVAAAGTISVDRKIRLFKQGKIIQGGIS